MDREYLQNIAGSSHVDEGLGDRILARGSSGLQRMSAMSGGNIDDLNYKKVQTLFNGFVKKLTTVLKDFAEGDHSVANRLEQMRPPISPVQRDTIEQIRDLYSSLIPSNFQQHQLGQSVLNPRNPNRSALSELLKEGIFNREMGLNKALQTNNPTTIINAYINEIKKAYDSFLRDAMKVTGHPRDFIKRTVGNLDKKWAPILNKVENVINASQAQQPAQPAVDPNAAAASSNPQAAPGAVPPVIPTNPVGVANTSPTPAPQPNSTEEDFAMIVVNVADIIIAAVQGDVERAAPYFKPGEKPGTMEPLPQDWDAPAVTKEAEEPAEDEKVPVPDFKDAPEGERNEFLYNFHSLYRKQRHFAIEVPQSGQMTFTNRVKKTLNKVDVVWSNNSHENNIYVKHTPVKKDKDAESQEDVLTPTGKAGDVLLFKFGDDQVNPRTGQKFTIQLILDQANANSKKILEAANKKNPKWATAITSRNDALQRALYATVSRKRMEFKPKKAVSLQMKDGQVFLKGKPISEDEIKRRLFSNNIIEAKNWLESLDSIEYFDAHPEMLEVRNKADAILHLVKADYLQTDAAKAVANVTHTMKPEDMQVNNIVTLAKQDLLKTKGSDFPPNAEEAFQALIAMGEKDNNDNRAKMTQVIDKLGKDKSTKDYFAGFKADPGDSITKTGNTTDMTSTGTSAVTSPVSAPVSKPVSTPVSAPVSAPVSSPKPEPEKAKSKDTLDVSDDGHVTGIDPKSKAVKTWKLGQALPDDIRAALKKNPEQAKKLVAAIEKRKQAKADALAAKAAKSKKPTDLTESLVDPFDSSNFL
jgi:hypothetical protein